jgi:transcriptional regulator with XRE-family HTH domain
VVSAQSPTVRRRELAARLRALRREAGLSVDEVAKKLLCSPAKISRIETAQRGASPRDVRDLCTLYGVSDAEQKSALMELAQQAKQRAWWQNYEEVMPIYATLIGLEVEAVSIRGYESILVPGLLQTPDYARAVIRAIQPGLDVAGVERLAEVRQARQEVLTRASPPSFWAVLDEAALRRQVGGVSVMREQILRIAERAELPNVTIQIIPFDAGPHAGMGGAFEILEFSQREVLDVIYIEGMTGGLYLDRDTDLSQYRTAFDHLRATAASPAASTTLLARLADDLRDNSLPPLGTHPASRRPTQDPQAQEGDE